MPSFEVWLLDRIESAIATNDLHLLDPLSIDRAWAAVTSNAAVG